jgi:glutathione S-transferase
VPHELCCHIKERTRKISDSLPTLWHIEISHYSEKARWALAYKGVEHRRRAPVPGAHIPVALWLTRGEQKTFPILTLEGRNVGDSTALIAALEDRFPDPPLYPADPEQRRRALELEDFFDEELGPHMRLLAFHEMRNDPERFKSLMEATAPGPLKKLAGPTALYARTYANLRFRVDSAEDAATARLKIVAALDRLEDELNGNRYLVGDSFTVADLTAAALFFPLVRPDEGPVPNDEPAPRGLEAFRTPLVDRDGFKWVEEMFSRHRQPAKAAVSAT